ncbi:hypothetical protein BDN70DRAFT_856259 [Pholiota conissans]|uniref:F-box domain-containing protein n=1 Tax=Pholiota conissans TaxID=109636 RepID=A0A9P6CUQ0_9AGAR|nr:hypothetical protein BDN70DRAFT_856259 [Pholiota conissans]
MDAFQSAAAKMSNETRNLLLIDDNTPTAEILRLVDEAIERPYQASPQVLKMLRNTFVPVSRLPPEILCSIFVILKEDKIPFSILPDLTWIKPTTHVCRHWREVAIASPNLWADPPVTNPSWTKLMLQRSKDTPLIIESDTFPSFRALGMIFEHSQRIKALKLRMKTMQMWNKVQKILPESLPQLESLQLSLSSGLGDVFSSKDVLSDAPNLRQMKLSDFDFNWNTHSRLLCGLTHLELRHIYPNSRLTWNLLVDVLQGLPDLEVLSFESSLPLKRNNMSNFWPQIHFASLRELSVDADSKAVETLFSFITFPPTTQTAVESYSADQPHSKAFSVSLARCAQIYSNLPSNSCFHTLVLCNANKDIRGFRLKLLGDELDDREALICSRTIPAHLEVGLTWRGNNSDPTTFEKVMNHVFSCGLPLHSVKRVILPELMLRLNPQILADTIGQLNQVCSVITSGDEGEIFIEALKLDLSTPGGDSLKPTYFANLSSILLHEAEFMILDIDDDGMAFSPLDSLHRCLAQRSRHGVKLEKLVFFCCQSFFQTEVDLFEEVVGCVECIDQEVFGSNYSDSDPDMSEEEADGSGDSDETINASTLTLPRMERSSLFYSI